MRRTALGQGRDAGRLGWGSVGDGRGGTRDDARDFNFNQDATRDARDFKFKFNFNVGLDAGGRPRDWPGPRSVLTGTHRTAQDGPGRGPRDAGRTWAGRNP